MRAKGAEKKTGANISLYTVVLEFQELLIFVKKSTFSYVNGTIVTEI